jgi:hypothetical protein
MNCAASLHSGLQRRRLRPVDGRRAPAHDARRVRQPSGIMSAILEHIQSLESYAQRSGATLVRGALPEPVHGSLSHNHITLRFDLSPEQHLLALVHELTHWLAHRDEGPRPPLAYCTIYEYEAEAVEALVMARLGLEVPARAAGLADEGQPTDGLLPSSVSRVISATQRICQALGLEQDA